MCGIAGSFYFNSTAAVEQLAPMLRAMSHRGPDGSGVYTRGPMAIGMRRLAIIDVAGGDQPIFNEDESAAIVLNGEIYNHLELRAELEQAGHRFRTHSDVEVVLHLYEEIGEKCFSRLNGMFAVAIADFRNQRLVLARDPFGQKPLYLWPQGQKRLWFASELKCLTTLDGFCKEVNQEALAAFLQFRYIPAPITIYKGVRKLLPGSFCVVDRTGAVTDQRYFQIDLARESTGSAADPDGSRTLDQLTEAVERHLMSERPLGVFLSGGLDSSAIVACMHRLGHQHIHTYTVGFEGFLDNEFATAQSVARHFQTNHNEVLLNADQFWETLGEVVYSADEPLGDLTTVPLYHLSKAASRELVVVLSGEGSDELLGGYPGMEEMRRTFERQESLRFAAPIARAISALPLPSSIGRKVRAVADSPAGYLAARQANITQIFDWDYRRAHGVNGIRDYNPGAALEQYYNARQDWDGVHLYLGALIEWWLPDDLLHKADRMTMAHSLELRCPFLDTGFARHCASLTLDDKVRDIDTEPIRKISLKKAFAGLLPHGIALQKKKGFTIPVYGWLADCYASRAETELNRLDGLGSSLFDAQSRRALLDAARRGDLLSQHRTWSLILLNRWGDCWL